jgi:hypothetical protein
VTGLTAVGTALGIATETVTTVAAAPETVVSADTRENAVGREKMLSGHVAWMLSMIALVAVISNSLLMDLRVARR